MKKRHMLGCKLARVGFPYLDEMSLVYDRRGRITADHRHICSCGWQSAPVRHGHRRHRRLRAAMHQHMAMVRAHQQRETQR